MKTQEELHSKKKSARDMSEREAELEEQRIEAEIERQVRIREEVDRRAGSRSGGGGGGRGGGGKPSIEFLGLWRDKMWGRAMPIKMNVNPGNPNQVRAG